MKKILLAISGCFFLASSCLVAQQRRLCGMELEKATLIAKDPSWTQRLDAQRNSLQGIADDYIKNKSFYAAQKTTFSGDTVPVIFHIIVNSWQFAAMGGYTGITQRCDSQIAILNRDFNRENADSVLIPSGWKHYYGNTGIHFGLAHTSPLGWGTPGYEIRIITEAGFYDSGPSFATAKTAATGGLDPWDNTKYLNVWCVNFTNGVLDTTSSGILGITVPLSFTASGGYPNSQEGICILYRVLGNDGPATGTSYAPYNLGRTLTHEMGHFFEIWHTWGDDGGLCPWTGGYDDGLSDTPPEAGPQYNNPTYTITGGTFYDACTTDGTSPQQPIGIACLSYLDYVDDNAMHLFTPMQAAAMASMVLVPGTGVAGATGQGLVGENYSLIQHPSLLTWPANTGVSEVQNNSSLSIYPNPTTGFMTLAFDAANYHLNEITIINMMGQQVLHNETAAQQNDIYFIDLSGMSKGIYFVKCNFATGTEIRKIVLE